MEGEATMSAFANMLEARGVTRRDFMKLCGTVAAAAGLSQLTVPQVAQALETSVISATKGNLYPVIWIEASSHQLPSRSPRLRRPTPRKWCWT